MKYYPYSMIMRESFNNTYFNELTSFMGCPEKTQMKVRKEALEKEIAKLKKRL